jgi:hypothetical protein
LDDVTAYREKGSSAWYRANLRKVHGHTQLVDQELQRKMEAAMLNGVNTIDIQFKTKHGQTTIVPVHIVRWQTQSAEPKLYDPEPAKTSKTINRKLGKLSKKVGELKRNLPTMLQPLDADATRRVLLPKIHEWASDLSFEHPTLSFEQFEQTLMLVCLKKREMLLEGDTEKIYKTHFVQTPRVADDPVTHTTEVIVPQMSVEDEATQLVSTETGVSVAELQEMFHLYSKGE